MPKGPLRIKELEQAIDAVVQSYDGSEEINNLESAALPNRRAVIDAFHHMLPVLFMGYYSTRSLNRDNLRHSISEHMYPAYEIFVEQIGRAVTYEERGQTDDRRRPPCWGEEVVQRLFAKLPAIRQLLNGDVLAAFEGDPAAKGIEEIVFSYPAILAITAHRLAHALYQERVPVVPRILSEYAHGKTGIDIHPGARIGERFFIDHGTGVVIGETAIIGNGVKLYQGVTLGALSIRRSQRGEEPLSDKRHPTLEDNVTIYSGATILGGDTVIGRDSIVGGNVWITKSLPPGTRIFGRPKD